MLCAHPHSGISLCLTSHRSFSTIVLVYLPLTYHPGEDNGTPLQYSCLVNPMDRGAW